MRLISTLIVILLFGNSFCQDVEIPAMNSVFWKVSNADNKNVGYLFGTIHLIDKDKYVLPKAVTKRLVKSDLLIMELADLNDQSGMMQLITLKEGRMTDILNSSQKDSLYDYTSRKFGMDSAMFESAMGKFKPVFFMQLPYSSLVLSSVSYDKNINEIALEEGIPIEGLETAEEQIGYFDNLPSSLKAKMIMQVIQDTSDFMATWDNMQELYLNQQVSDMLTLNTGGADIMKFYETTLSSDRNKRWVRILKNHLIDTPTFIAVGAGHLPGKEGLIHLLEQEGFVLTPIQIKLK